MRSEAGLAPPSRELPHGEIVIRLPATNGGVRTGVVRASTLFEEAGASEEDLTAIELALAEVLNNVVEHAYEDTGEGEMDLCIDVQPPDVYIRVLDSGIPMPKGRLPLGKAADTSRPAFEQDEGGYGLFMIRQLARKLRYARNGDRNQLSFRITLGAERNWDTDLPL